MSDITRKTKHNIIIVGAGASGLGAAHYLHKNGISDIVILEANNRIGGRIHTVPFGSRADNIVELGANWIEGGTVANPMYTLLIQKGFWDTNGDIPIMTRFQHCHFGKPDGTVIDPECARKCIRIFFEVERGAHTLFYRRNAVVSEDANLLDHLREELQSRVKSDFRSETEQQDAKLAFRCLVNYLLFHVGDDLEKASLKRYGTYRDMPGGAVIVPGGFLKLIEKLADELPSGCIRFGQKVRCIRWHNVNPMGRRRNGQSTVTIECEDGTQWSTDRVILTCSLGHLKQHQATLFQPELPKDKVDAISKIGFGCTNKIFLYFPQPFWKSGRFGNLGLCWEDEETELRKATSDCTNESDRWVRSISGFEEVYNNPNVLLCWLGGRGARAMENVSETDILHICTELLIRFTGNPTLPKPTKILRTAWASDPLTRGSYSYATGVSGLPEIDRLAQPLPSTDNPILMFAGEATHPCYYSTVHGAFLSGLREGQRAYQAISATLSKESRL